MIKNLCTLEEVKAHIRVDSDDEDELIETYIRASSAAICRKLVGVKIHSDDEEEEVFPDIKLACMTLVAEFYRYREGDNPNKINDLYASKYLPYGVEQLIAPFLDWMV